MEFIESNPIENFNFIEKFIEKCKLEAGIYIKKEIDVIRIIDVIICGIADALYSSKNKSSAIIFSNGDDEMIMAAVIEYAENANTYYIDDYYFTFDPNDTEGKNIYNISDIEITSAIAKKARDTYRMIFIDTKLITVFSLLFASLVRKFFDSNIKKGEKFGVKCEECDTVKHQKIIDIKWFEDLINKIKLNIN